MVKILITVIALLLIVFVISRRTQYFVITPQFAFTVSFLPALVMLSLFVDKWEVDLDNRTIALIISGAVVFTAVSFLSERLFRRRITIGPARKETYRGPLLYQERTVENVKLLLFLCIGFFGVGVYLMYVASFSGGFSLGNISGILSRYRDIYNEESPDMPTFVSVASMISTCIADYCVFYFFRNRAQLKGKSIKKILLVLCCVPGLMIPVLSGARGGIINFGIFVFATAIITSAKEIKLQRKTIKLAIVMAVLAVASLRVVGVMMGRDIGENAIDYIGMYLSAPIKNLDYTIQTESIGLFSGFGTGNRTFGKLLTFLSFRFGLQFTPVDERSFRMFNGHNTGNMYTVYYNLVHDAGFIGALLMIALTAFLCQIFYAAMKRMLQEKRAGNTVTLVYCLVYSCLFLSFFNETFFFTVVTNYFLRQVIVFLLLDWFVRRIRFRAVNADVPVTE